MENRRQYYRHPFPPARGLSVSFQSTDESSRFAGDIINLSIGGVCVGTKARAVTPGKNWLATLTLGTHGVTLTMPVEQVHTKDDEPGQCGFRFLPRPNPRVQEEQERQIWSFLLDEQRGQRRLARERREASA
jgi:hypothetical protein